MVLGNKSLTTKVVITANAEIPQKKISANAELRLRGDDGKEPPSKPSFLLPSNEPLSQDLPVLGTIGTAGEKR